MAKVSLVLSGKAVKFLATIMTTITSILFALDSFSEEQAK